MTYLTENIEDETGFVNWVESMISNEGNVLGHREDAVAVVMGDDILVLNIDGWVESTDRPEGMNPQQVGYRAVANAISDVIVKGARPEGMIISSALSKDHRDQLKQIIAGFRRASDDFSTPFFGGDINTSTDLVIDVTVWGRTRNLVRRDGAQPGDHVYWLGPDLGCTAAALGILTQNWKGSRQKALEVMGEPSLFFDFLEIDATAATDSSDGLARSLYHIANASQVGIELRELPQPVPWIAEVAERNGVDLTDLYLFGGEELGVVFTIGPDQDPGENALLLGEVTDTPGVWYAGNRVEDKGWDHLAA